MKCSGCGKTSSHIKVLPNGDEVCPHCSSMSEAGGTKISGLLTRNSFRVRSESVKHEGDFIQPHAYDKNKRKLCLNEDFVKKYPDKVKEYFSEEEVSNAGYCKLSNHMKKQKEAEIKHKNDQRIKFAGKGQEGKRIKELLDE